MRPPRTGTFMPMGRLLYSAATSRDGFTAGPDRDMQFVVTDDPPAESDRDVTFTDDLAGVIGAARAAAGEPYVGVLGAEDGPAATHRWFRVFR
jgi:hypothetical protein